MHMGENIATLRKQKGMTQEELAQQLQVSNQAVSKWESAKCYPDMELLPKIAGIFGCSIDALFFGQPLPAEHPAAQLPPEQLERFRALEGLARQHQKGVLTEMEFTSYKWALLQDICRVSEDEDGEYPLEKSECFLLLEELARQHEKGTINAGDFRAFKWVLLNVISGIQPEEIDDPDAIQPPC